LNRFLNFDKILVGQSYQELKTSCNLPDSWSGVWLNQQQQDKDQFIFDSILTGSSSSSSTKTISDISFLNKGTCVTFRDERYFFYDT
jgi:hypothetical protein